MAAHGVVITCMLIGNVADRGLLLRSAGAL